MGLVSGKSSEVGITGESLPENEMKRGTARNLSEYSWG
jgi:hypothetical protein